MKLANGKFYTNNKGVAVNAQIESDGKFHCYDCTGKAVAQIEDDTHVEGWLPIGRAVFNGLVTEAKKAAKKAGKEADKEDSKDSKKKVATD